MLGRAAAAAVAEAFYCFKLLVILNIALNCICIAISPFSITEMSLDQVALAATGAPPPVHWGPANARRSCSVYWRLAHTRRNSPGHWRPVGTRHWLRAPTSPFRSHPALVGVCVIGCYLLAQPNSGSARNFTCPMSNHFCTF